MDVHPICGKRDSTCTWRYCDIGLRFRRDDAFPIPHDGACVLTGVDWKIRAEIAEAALRKIREHVFADLPEITAPPRNRLQVIAAIVDTTLDE